MFTKLNISTDIKKLHPIDLIRSLYYDCENSKPLINLLEIGINLDQLQLDIEQENVDQLDIEQENVKQLQLDIEEKLEQLKLDIEQLQLAIEQEDFDASEEVGEFENFGATIDDEIERALVRGVVYDFPKIFQKFFLEDPLEEFKYDASFFNHDVVKECIFGSDPPINVDLLMNHKEVDPSKKPDPMDDFIDSMKGLTLALVGKQ